jgi:hypothetical protein
MSALNSARNTPALGRYTPLPPMPVEAATVVYVGGMACLDKNGLLVPAQRIGSAPLDVLRVVGICGGAYLGHPGQTPKNLTTEVIPGTTQAAGAAGAIKADVWTGTFLMDIGAGSITQADVGALCYAEDDHTVYDTSDTAARPVAGTIVALEGGMVWVDFTRQSARA